MFIIRISFAHTTPKPQKGAKRVEEQNRMSGRGRRVKLAAVYLLAALADLDSAIAGADLVITGEGRTDRQTLMGKLPYRVAQRAKKLGKRCVVISGDGDGTLVGDKVITLTDKDTPPRAAIAHAAALLAEKADLLLQ